MEEAAVSTVDGDTLIAITKRFNDAWNAGDVDAVMGFFHDDATVRIMPPPPPPNPEVYTGREQIRDWVARTLSLPFSVEASNYRVLGSVVTWDARFPHEGPDAPEEVSEAVFEGTKIKDFIP
jgi:hypothetical protein